MKNIKKTNLQVLTLPKIIGKTKFAAHFSLKSLIYVCVVCASTSGCIAPRSMMDSGKVTPKNQIKAGFNYSINIPTQTIKNAVEAIKTADDDTIYSDALNRSARYLFAYALDPLFVGMNYYARYGVISRFDIGYKYASGTHCIDARYQFLGSLRAIGSVSDKAPYGSIGLQYSSTKYKLPFGFDKIQDRLGFDLKRKDIMIPLIFSLSLGDDEKIGHIAIGIVYNHTFLEYGYDPKGVYDIQSKLPIAAKHFKKNYPSFGAFGNLKVGYKYIYFLASFSVYYQNYGNFTMLDGSMENFSGYTFVPSFGFQIIIPPLGKKKQAVPDRHEQYLR